MLDVWLTGSGGGFHCKGRDGMLWHCFVSEVVWCGQASLVVSNEFICEDKTDWMDAYRMDGSIVGI